MGAIQGINSSSFHQSSETIKAQIQQFRSLCDPKSAAKSALDPQVINHIHRICDHVEASLKNVDSNDSLSITKHLMKHVLNLLLELDQIQPESLKSLKVSFDVEVTSVVAHMAFQMCDPQRYTHLSSVAPVEHLHRRVSAHAFKVSPSHNSSEATGKALVDFVNQELTDEELKLKLLANLLEDGIDGIHELNLILAIIGSLSNPLPTGMIQDLEQHLDDFFKTEQATSSNPMELLATFGLISKIAQDVGIHIPEPDLSAIGGVLKGAMGMNVSASYQSQLIINHVSVDPSDTPVQSEAKTADQDVTPITPTAGSPAETMAGLQQDQQRSTEHSYHPFLHSIAHGLQIEASKSAVAVCREIVVPKVQDVLDQVAENLGQSTSEFDILG